MQDPFHPQPHPRQSQALFLATLAHGLLVAALAWGVSWRHQTESISVTAELWSQVPVVAAPKLASAAPQQPPAPPDPAPPPAPNPKAPDIAVEKTPKNTNPAAQIPNPDLLKRQAQQRAQERHAQERHAQEQLAQEAARQETLKRMQGLAGASGANQSAGSAMQSTGPSASYAAKVNAKVRANIVFSDADALPNNAACDVDIRVAPDGLILLPIRLSKSSGNKAWDNAVLRAIEKTEYLPRDADGKVPSSMTLVVRPRP